MVVIVVVKSEGDVKIMDKSEANIVLEDELLELSIVLGKAKAAGEAVQKYFFEEEQTSLMREKFCSASFLNSVVLDYLDKACKMINYIDE